MNIYKRMLWMRKIMNTKYSETTNEQLWNKLDVILDILDKSIIKNKNGQVAKIELVKDELIITTNNEKFIYKQNENIQSVINDGWIFE
jgi:hypothetical protein